MKSNLRIIWVVLLSVLLAVSLTSCVGVVGDSEGDSGAEAYQYWKSSFNASYDLLNFAGTPATTVTGKPFLVLTYDRISLEITDCEFGLSEVTQKIIAEGGIYEPTLNAEMIYFHEKLGLQSPVALCVSWGNKSIVNGVQQFSFLSSAVIGPAKNSEKWIFNYTSGTMTGGVTNLDTYYFLGRQSETNAFKMVKQ